MSANCTKHSLSSFINLNENTLFIIQQEFSTYSKVSKCSFSYFELTLDTFSFVLICYLELHSVKKGIQTLIKITGYI